MSSRPVTVRAPGRLHFGMFSFGVPTLRQYGGVGVMIDQHQTELQVTPADRFACLGFLLAIDADIDLGTEHISLFLIDRFFIASSQRQCQKQKYEAQRKSHCCISSSSTAAASIASRATTP